MMVPLLHHGMIITGIPYSQAALHTTSGGGSPYGATSWAPSERSGVLTEDEKTLAKAHGRRVAQLALQLGTL